VKVAERTQKTSFEPTLKLFLVVGIFAALTITIVSASIAYVMLTVSGVPTLVYLLLPVILAFEVSLDATLIYSLRKTPPWLRQLERRFLEPA
jgi:hypothetical protein